MVLNGDTPFVSSESIRALAEIVSTGGAVMAVLVWAYLAALAIMLGSQTAYTYRGVFGSQAGTIALPEPRQRANGRSRPRDVRSLLATPWKWMQPAEEEPK